MSRNLVEIIRRHHELGAPTALEVLKAAIADHGEITDDDRRDAAQRSGLPEAAVHGVSTFYDDLLQPRGARHIRVCTGTACFAATGGAHVAAIEDGFGCELGRRAPDGSVSLAETVCLGLCHSSPAIRDGDVIDAGPGVVERVLADAARSAREPPPRCALDEPVLLSSGHGWAALSRAVAT
ncbi:MAG: NADH-quinone oxidoreductase subunit, partial [Solirubrobacteraceae bacterium]|nr:NADH-quinone oxidoreductase subunit [Solirubrobacteraceae bacterium]